MPHSLAKGSSGPTDSMKTIDPESPMRERLNAELAKATAELKAHMATWEYAFAMAGGCHGGRDHPVHWATHARGGIGSGSRKTVSMRAPGGAPG